MYSHKQRNCRCFSLYESGERGIKALAGDVSKTYDVQQWNVIPNEMEAEIGNMRKSGIPGLSKQQKDEKLEF